MAGKLNLSIEVLNALRTGNKVEAIRLIREKSGMGLAEAKALVDAYDQFKGVAGAAKGTIARHVAGVQQAPGTTPLPGLSPGEEPRGGGALHAVVVIVVAIVLGMLWFKLG
ncbi:MAG TPA: ribosomal protein L7/L12 [Usitatibacter sp.]|jgi:hypothetical protein|nr:ribosomal protein L7/L12 [Usitatibacter sp.]